ncbi:glutathione S-transferase domain-containing protein [Pendulispora brunnea]|uniref:Glutathione S-transferase domain-containing protein n=1 Tax=Pendulispora brunnea TaxID=2905690 RepID=A0ABZ2JZX4_9BACT
MVTKPVIVGRSSSHFTRVARIFAAELNVDCDFRVVQNLMASDPSDYGGNPALKMPTLLTSQGAWFGALPICRELARQSSLRPRIVWPEDLDTPLLSNAQELTLQAMATGVALTLGKVSGVPEENAHRIKMQQSLLGTMAWLDMHVAELSRALPVDRDFSFLEVTLFCAVTHFEFRAVVAISSYPALKAFAESFSVRPSASATNYRFDP